MKILNLGCGHKVSAHPDVINIDWSMYLRIRASGILSALVPLLLHGERRKRYARLPRNILLHDLSQGIPFPENSVDVIFHSNMLEHLDRSNAEQLLAEALRALKPGGIHRIVVPDFEHKCRAYMAHIEQCKHTPQARSQHEDFIELLLEQSVRREAVGTSRQPPLRRFIENALLGDARSRGETHQWMYDRISLENLLQRVGYHDIKLMRFDASGVPGWDQFGLDTHVDGSEYAPGSLYMEARK